MTQPTPEEIKKWWEGYAEKLSRRKPIPCHIEGIVDDVIETDAQAIRVRIFVEGIDMPMKPPSKTVAFDEVREHLRALKPYLAPEFFSSCSIETLATTIFAYMRTAPWASSTKWVSAVELLRADGTGARVRQRDVLSTIPSIF